MGDHPDLLEFERIYWQQGVTRLAGVDEVGRGCLAGPVVAAAVVFPVGCFLAGVRDSKQLTAAQRVAVFPLIQSHALAVGLGVVDPIEIDAINILQASRKAMRLAVEALSQSPEHLLLDGRERVDLDLPQTPIIKGDARSLTIAAASIIAKVTRDRLMVAWQTQYPQFSFGVHKGYGTPRHLDELRCHGVTSLHRKTFAPVRERLIA